MSELRYEITIDATTESVYAHLTERAGLLRWMGVAVTSDPVRGGDLTWTHENGATMIGRYVELDPPHRVVFFYGWKDNLMGVPPASTRVEIQLSPTASGTHLTLTHWLLPTDAANDHHAGWDHFLGHLAGVLESTTGSLLE